MSLVGARVLRKEDPNLLAGRGTFVDDLSPTGTAFAMFVMSPHPHARITAMDLRGALAVPGVVGVWTAADFAGYPDLPGGLQDLSRPAMAVDVVRFVGEPVAVVVADDRYVAADAAAAVEVTYEVLPFATTLQHATTEHAPLLFPHHRSNTITSVPMIDDGERELQRSAGRVHLHIVNQRCAAVPIEPMAVLADWSPGGLTVWATFQAPHHLRNSLSTWLDVPQNTCRVIAPDVGGGFGAKIVWYPELFLAPLLSKWTGRPVKFAQTRSEAMQQMTHGRAQVHDVDVGYATDGTIEVLRLVVTQDLGAYPDPTGLGLPVLTSWMAAGCYRIPKVVTGFRTVVTNTTPIAAYRGAGRPEAAYTIERVIDLIARRTGLDPAEVRRRNFIQPKAFPYKTHNDAVVYDSGNFPAALAECLRLLDYDTVRARQADRTRADDILLGVGLSAWLEIAGFGPNGSLEGFGHLASWESTQVRMQPDGSAIVFVGSSPHGQGHETTFAQIASDELGVPFERITVVHGDTETVLQGIGTMGSRGVPTAGSAVKVASARVLAKAKRIAAHLLEAAVEDLEVSDNAFRVRGSPGKTVGWGDVAWASFQPLRLPPELLAGSLEERLFQESPNFSYPSGVYGCVVGVDRRTGRVTIERMVLVDDCGTVINPLLAEGQVHGGVAQGIAQALFEEVVYDASSGQPTTTNLLDYLVPSAPDLPSYVAGRTTTLCPNNPLGAKGIGESGAVGAPAAVVNAVIDALAPFGIEHLDMPLLPDKVWAAIAATEVAR